MRKKNIYLKNTSRKLACLLLVTTVSITSLQPVFATRKSQAQDAKKAAESNLNTVNNNINSISNKQQQLQKEINALDAELVSLLVDMNILSDELDQQEVKIKQANEDLSAAKKEERDQYERMKKRIQYMYERGDSSLLEALLGATSMDDFLNRVNYFNAVHEYDRDQLDVYKETKQQVMDLKTQLLEEQSQMEEMQDNYKVQETELKSMVSQKEATMDDFDSQLEQAKVLAAAYQETIQQQNQIIRDEEEKERIAREAAERAAREAAEAENALQEKRQMPRKEKRRNALRSRLHKHSSRRLQEAVRLLEVLPAALHLLEVLRQEVLLAAAQVQAALRQSALQVLPAAMSLTMRHSLLAILTYGAARA